jgi:3-oxoacyl-[acyl-carrier-protein] synthase III
MLIFLKYLLILVKALLYPLRLFLHSTPKKYTSKIIGTGCYLPKKYVTNKELLQNMNLEELQKKFDRSVEKGSINADCTLEEFITKYYHISGRYCADETETNSYMGAQAIRNAVSDAIPKI